YCSFGKNCSQNCSHKRQCQKHTVPVCPFASIPSLTRLCERLRAPGAPFRSRSSTNSTASNSYVFDGSPETRTWDSVLDHSFFVACPSGGHRLVSLCSNGATDNSFFK